MMPSTLSLLVLAVALPSPVRAANLSNCKGGCPGGERCVGNAFAQPVEDSECDTCSRGRYFWPCNFETLCFCSDTAPGAPRVPPAPKTRLPASETVEPCRDVLTRAAFDTLVRPGSAEGQALYTYDGLCRAIAQYNAHHDEKFAGMGSEDQIRAELAAFLAHTAVDTRGYAATREGLHCVDPITGSDGAVYCKPCTEEHYDAQNETCVQKYFELGTGPTSGQVASKYTEYCDATRQGTQGCTCSKDGVAAVAVPLPPDAAGLDADGYIPASSAYFARGALPLSWNYDFYAASQSMTGDPAVLCDDPDLVSTDPQYAWGAGLYKWMEVMTWGSTGTTAHQQAVQINFGGTVQALWGKLECPTGQWINAAHVQLLVERVAEVCRAGVVLGVYLEMDRCDGNSDCLQCEGLYEVYSACRADGKCPECNKWTEHMVSVAPTVTPIRVKSPEDFSSWFGHYNPRSGAVLRAWSAVSFFILVVSLGGALAV